MSIKNLSKAGDRADEMIREWLRQPMPSAPALTRVRQILWAIRYPDGREGRRRFTRPQLVATLQEKGGYPVAKETIRTIEIGQTKKNIFGKTLLAIAWFTRPSAIESKDDPRWRDWVESTAYWMGVSAPIDKILESEDKDVGGGFFRDAKDAADEALGECYQLGERLNNTEILIGVITFALRSDRLIRSKGFDLANAKDLEVFRSASKSVGDGKECIDVLLGTRPYASDYAISISKIFSTVFSEKWTGNKVKSLSVFSADLPATSVDHALKP